MFANFRMTKLLPNKLNLQNISSKVNLVSSLITTDLIWFSAAGASQLKYSDLWFVWMFSPHTVQIQQKP